MARELPDLLHSFTAEEWIGTNITPKLRHTENILTGFSMLYGKKTIKIQKKTAQSFK